MTTHDNSLSREAFERGNTWQGKPLIRDGVAYESIEVQKAWGQFSRGYQAAIEHSRVDVEPSVAVAACYESAAQRARDYEAENDKLREANRVLVEALKEIAAWDENGRVCEEYGCHAPVKAREALALANQTTGKVGDV